MLTVGDVFTATMSLIGELADDGSALHADTVEYQQRTPSLLMTLLAEYRATTGKRGTLLRLTGLADYLVGVEDNFAMGVLPYGLASMLLLDEDANRAAFFQEEYEEEKTRYTARALATVEPITDVYGGIEYGQFGAW